LFKLADWRIDLALVGASWDPIRYHIEHRSQWGSTEHRVQILDILPVFDQISD